MASRLPRRRAATAALIALGALAALGGCAAGAYRVPEAQGLAASALAVLEEEPKPTIVSVSAVNGTSRPWGLFERYELAPRPTRLTVRLVEGGTTRVSDPLELQFTPEAGATYVLRGTTQTAVGGGGRWQAWVVHKASGKTVSTVVQK